MHRFFIPKSDIFENTARVSGAEFEHIRVLRLRPGEVITLCDGAGTDYICRFTGISGNSAEAEVVKTLPSTGEPSVKCTVCAAFSKGDRLDYTVQKSVELGASEILLFPSERCIAVPDGKALEKKLDRLRRIAYEAAKQSGRGIVTPINAAPSFEAAVTDEADAELSLFFYEEERTLELKEALESRPDAKTVSIVTGPEGGFEPNEAELAMSRGLISVSLGPRILRCETAPICALSAIMYATGNL